MQRFPLTSEDRRMLRHEMRPGLIVAVICIALGIIVTTALFIGDVVEHDELFRIYLRVAVIAVFLYLVFNRNHLLDLRRGTKVAELKQVAAKEGVKSFEAGSGLPYTPGLGDMFPKLWKQKPRSSQIYYIVIDNQRIMVPENLYNNLQAGDTVTVYYTERGHNRLSIEKKP